MVKHLLFVGMLLAALLAVSPALAEINPESFTADEYVAGNALSDFYWQSGDITTGVLDIEDIGGNHERVVKLTANGPDPGPLFPSITGTATGWGGPTRVNDDRLLWYRADIQKGTGDGNTSLTDNIYSLSFVRGNGNMIYTLDGGLGTVRLRVGEGNVNPIIDVATFDLNDGWNTVVLLNDRLANPNVVMYLNGAQVATYNAPGGPSTSRNGQGASTVSLQRQSRGGDADNFVGSMRFDNIITADESLLPMPDVNMDSFVDIFDVNEISANWGMVGGPYFVPGDANKDGTVDIFDINLVSANWAPQPPPGGSAAVPEPATCVLLALGLAGLLVVGRKRFGR